MAVLVFRQLETKDREVIEKIQVGDLVTVFGHPLSQGLCKL